MRNFKSVVIQLQGTREILMYIPVVTMGDATDSWPLSESSARIQTVTASVNLTLFSQFKISDLRENQPLTADGETEFRSQAYNFICIPGLKHRAGNSLQNGCVISTRVRTVSFRATISFLPL